jgi:hypothetical protein
VLAGREGDQALTRISNQIHNYYQLNFEPPTAPAYAGLPASGAARRFG